MLRFLSTVLMSICFLSACSHGEQDNKTSVGPTTATGTLIAAEVSLIRRGSHKLIIDGKPTYYVESKSENLREYEGRTVSIQGIVEKNTRQSDLPILVVEKISSDVGSDGLHLWNIPALNLRIAAPEEWKASIKGTVATFALDNETETLLSIVLLSGSTLPPGSTFYVNNRPAVRTESAGNTIQEVYILEKDTVIRLHFDSSTQRSIQTKEEGTILADEFERLLSNVVFLSDSKRNTISAGSGSGVACGGEAGILCASGYYCNITEGDAKIGVCVQRK